MGKDGVVNGNGCLKNERNTPGVFVSVSNVGLSEERFKSDCQRVGVREREKERLK